MKQIRYLYIILAIIASFYNYNKVVFGINLFSASDHAIREDLSKHRIDFPLEQEISDQSYFNQTKKTKKKPKKFITPTHDITHRLSILLMDLKHYYAMTPFIKGYSIQAYAGTDRKQAYKVKEKICLHYPQVYIELLYKQPHFIVQVGRYLDFLEAYPLYIPIKKMFSKTIIRPCQLPNQPNLFQPLNTNSSCGNNEIKKQETKKEDEERNAKKALEQDLEDE